MQCLGASGACHMGALFLKLHYEPFKHGQPRKVYIPAESWGKLGLPLSLSLPLSEHSEVDQS